MGVALSHLIWRLILRGWAKRKLHDRSSEMLGEADIAEELVVAAVEFLI